MRILLCVTNDIATDQRVNRIAISLQKISTSVLIIGTKKKDSLSVDRLSVKTHRFKMIFKKGPGFYSEYNLRLFYYLLFHKVDIVVANDLDTLLAVYLASILNKYQVVYDSHEYFTELPELVNRPFIKSVWEKLEHFLLPKITCSYTVNRSIASEYHKKYKIQMEVIRNLPLRINEIHEIKRINNNSVILYQGSLNMGRGIEAAIHAMKFMENTNFYIAGSGYLEEVLKDLVMSLNLAGKVIFTGRLHPNELAKLTLQADLGISLEENMGLNYYYSLPNKLFDYIQARIPVLVSDLPEMRSIVMQYNLGRIADSLEPLYLAGIFSDMLNNREARLVWKEGLEKASSELCWEKEEYKLIQLFSALKR